MDNDSEETTAPEQSSSVTTDDDLFPSLDPRKPLTTTTTEEPEILGKKHRPVRGCKLPVRPNEPGLAQSVDGLSYGAKRTSRTEVKLEDGKVKEIEKNAKIELKFKTTKGSGLLLLLLDKKFIDHTLISIVDNKLHCSFNLGSGDLVTTSDKEILSDTWHNVIITRDSKDVTVKIDDEVKTYSTPGDKTALNVNPVLYIGGLPNDLIERASTKMNEMYNSFEGCINDVKLNDEFQILDLQESFDGVISCNETAAAIENGLFFRGKFFIFCEFNYYAIKNFSQNSI